MSVLRHWLAYRERWQDAPRVITPRDDADVAEWRRLGYRVEGPFVLEAALHEAIQLARDFNRGAMTWQEYDRKLAALEVAHPGG
jgi:hypothetical protein